MPSSFSPAGGYRGKIAYPLARWQWDTGLVIGGWFPQSYSVSRSATLFLGVPVLPSRRSFMLTIFGTFWQLLSPFALLCGSY
ncbi:hypothetical protein KCP75_06195 [Salmonella enterica subsp. enterica]|nr:hypothetical protein KCP75_06195 [Salmonella enterica subsp. enterica]